MPLTKVPKRACLVTVQEDDGRVFLRLFINQTTTTFEGKPIYSGAFVIGPMDWPFWKGFLSKTYDTTFKHFPKNAEDKDEGEDETDA
jgi:hypothetical protein